MSYVQLDKAKNVVINEEGKLMVNGTRPLYPDTDEETGLKIFKVRSDKEIGQKDTRFVHVEVLRHFGDVQPCPFLGPEDVEFLDEDLPNPYVHTNLQLSESGREKVFARGAKSEKAKGKSEKAITDGADSADGTDFTEAGADLNFKEGFDQEAVVDSEEGDRDSELQSDKAITDGADGTDSEDPSKEEDVEGSEQKAEALSQPDDDEGTGSGGDGGSDAEEESEKAKVKSEKEESAVEESPEKVFEAVKHGGYYDVVDPATGDSVLADFGRDKKLQGKKGVEDFASEHSIEIEIP